MVGDSESGSLRTQLLHMFHTLPEAQQKVAAWFLAEGGRFCGCSIDDVVQNAKVSPTAVVRMCQALGLQGYRDFRLRWALEELGKPSTSSLEPDSILHSSFVALRETEELLEGKTVETAARYIVESKQVLIYGAGASGLVAGIAAWSLSWAGHRAFALSDTFLHSSPLGQGQEKTAVMVISHRGSRPEIYDRLRTHRDNGDKLIVMTSVPDSKLARLADALLLTGCPTPACPSNLRLALSAARIAQTAVIQTLVEATLRLRVEK